MNPPPNSLAYVVVLNWNGLAYVRDCLRSLLAQTHPSYRVIVVDNASTDGSREVMQDEFPEATLIALPENLHFARGTNAGIIEALKDPQCAYVVTLNNDTRVDSEWLAELVRPAREPTVGSVASKMLFMDRPGILDSTGILVARDGSGTDRGWFERDEGQYDHALDVFGPSAGAALYRREVLDAVGLLDADFVAYYEDLDLAWRARLAGWESRFAPAAVVLHKYSASSSPLDPWKTYQGERNRIWNLVQNYPWRHVALGTGWYVARLAWALGRHTFPSESPAGMERPRFSTLVKAMARGGLDGYAGIPKALEKRRRRKEFSRVSAETVGRWLRLYGVSIRNMPGL
jgi:GT2 family glycosyltransferase